MDNEQIKKIVEDVYDDSMNEGFASMLGDFYNKKTASVAIFIWFWGLVFIAIAIYCGVQFFKTESSQYQTMYAALFITFMMFLSIIKIFAWQMIHRNNLKREIKKLELRIAELTEIIKNK